MEPSQLIILAIIATPVVILGRDAFDRRRARPQVLLALGVLLAILANIAITLTVGRARPARIGANSQRQGSSQQCRSDERTLMPRGPSPHPEVWYNNEHNRFGGGAQPGHRLEAI